MLSFVVGIHLFVAVLLIFLVLVQDSKGGAMGGMFAGGGSNSILGPTGAPTLFAKMTRIMAVVFAVTCMALTVIVARESKSVIDSGPVTAAPAAPSTETAPAAPAQDAAPAADAPKK